MSYWPRCSIVVSNTRSYRFESFWWQIFLPPATKLGQAYIFTGVCDSVNRGVCVVAAGGVCMVAPGGHAWLLRGGCAWLLLGGMHGCSRGGAWFLPGGMRGFCQEGCAWFFLGEHVWFFLGGACVGYDEIQSMSGQYTSYWNAFLLVIEFAEFRENSITPHHADPNMNSLLL